MATVLVTAAGGGRVGVGAVEWLSKETDHKIIGVDMHYESGGLYCCDKQFQVPAATDDRWANKIAYVINKEKVSVVIPSLDASLLKITEVKKLTDRDVKFISARDEIISMAFDKYKTADYLSNRGITVPSTVTGNKAAELSTDCYPAVIKPRVGQGNSLGSGVEIVHTPEDAAQYVDSQDEPANDYIVQEYIEGTEYTTSVLGTKQNELLAVVPKEAINSNPYHRVTRDAQHIQSTCTEMFHTLEPEGVLNIQHIVQDEIVYTIEINPRFSSSSSLTAAAGINGYKLLVADALGESVTVEDGFAKDRHLLQHPANVYVNDSDLISNND